MRYVWVFIFVLFLGVPTVHAQPVDDLDFHVNALSGFLFTAYVVPTSTVSPDRQVVLEWWEKNNIVNDGLSGPIQISYTPGNTSGYFEYMFPSTMDTNTTYQYHIVDAFNHQRIYHGPEDLTFTTTSTGGSSAGDDLEFVFDPSSVTNTSVTLTAEVYPLGNADPDREVIVQWWELDNPSAQDVSSPFQLAFTPGDSHATFFFTFQNVDQKVYEYQVIDANDQSVVYHGPETIGGWNGNTGGGGVGSPPPSSGGLLSAFTPIVPCGGTYTDGSPQPDCDFGQVIVLINNIIGFLLFVVAMPLAALLFAYVGFLYLTKGSSSGARQTARTILLNVVLGLVIALSAWLVINTILKTFGVTGDQENLLEQSQAYNPENNRGIL